jgi:hypothetical protein
MWDNVSSSRVGPQFGRPRGTAYSSHGGSRSRRSGLLDQFSEPEAYASYCTSMSFRGRIQAASFGRYAAAPGIYWFGVSLSDLGPQLDL